MDAIPIQALVDKTKAFVAARTVEFLVAKAVLALPFLAWPVISTITRKAIEWGVEAALTFMDGQLFNLNMDILTRDQASDYRKTIAALELAPDDISDADWMKLEQDANHKFDELVRLAK